MIAEESGEYPHMQPLLPFPYSSYLSNAYHVRKVKKEAKIEENILI
jgi:hypothetical protein